MKTYMRIVDEYLAYRVHNYATDASTNAYTKPLLGRRSKIPSPLAPTPAPSPAPKLPAPKNTQIPA